jgi:hypothetical protein
MVIGIREMRIGRRRKKQVAGRYYSSVEWKDGVIEACEL